MTDAEALLAGVLATPDDDVPRLVLADWLEENGEPDRAEFIRVQIERTTLTRVDPRYKECTRRERVLLNRNKEDWLRPFQKFWPGCFVRFERGFVAVIKSSAAYMLINAEELWSLAPIREVHVTDGHQRLRELCWLSRPPQVRIRVGVIGNFDTLPTLTIDALPPRPPRLEPCLRTGLWLILGYAISSGPDLVAVSRFSHYVARQSGALGSVNFAVRPYQIVGEFRSWCPIPPTERGPHWLLVRDGRLVSHACGHLEADALSGTFWTG